MARINRSSSLGWKLDDEELKEAYNTLDQDKNGIVDFGEFVNCECR
jgi:Ca2+-binding EF-hand superfamily protein